MSQTLYVSLDRELNGVEINHDRVFLARLVGDLETLAATASKLGTASLSTFQSYSAEDMADLVHDPGELNIEPVKWFEPKDALPAVKALQQHYANNRFVIERGRKQHGSWEPVDRTDDLLRELRDLECVLVEAEKAGAKFRLHIGF